ncbi:MAG: hypothetical protein RL391_1407 [Actinomycetota bacterium]|jgi:hypothetical protein
MTSEKNPIAVVAVTQNETRVWLAGLDHDALPIHLQPPSDLGQHHHVRQAQHHRGHDTDHDDPDYFESIARALAGTEEILLFGHGHGKASHMLRFTQYLERKHPSIARAVVGAVDSDLNALTEPQILAEARTWFRTYHRTGIKGRASH